MKIPRAIRLAVLTFHVSGNVFAAPADLPLFSINDLVYEGAFRFPDDDFGLSSMNYSQGPLVYNPANHSIFIVGHGSQQAIAEFDVPELINSGTLSSLRMAGAPRQTFARVINRAPSGNPQRIDRIGGMGLFNGPSGPELLVNTFEYYDNDSDTHTNLVLRNASDLAGSAVEGFFTFQGGPGHVSGWISPVPSEWQPILGGSHLTGMSSGWPIISRLSVGPSAFAFNPSDVIGNAAVPIPVPTVRLLDFFLDPLPPPAVSRQLDRDLNNYSRANDLWTHLSFAVYGMIVPGTRTYMTLGHSGGHATGVCYKCIPVGATAECGGYCANDVTDYASYYWLWDVNDLVRVKERQLASYAVRPYAYGTFSTPFSNPRAPLGGGSYDPASGLLYLTVQRADRAQGSETNPPVVVAYRFNVPTNALLPARPRRLRVRP